MSIPIRDIHEGHEYVDIELYVKKVTKIIKHGRSESFWRVKWESGNKKGECSVASFAQWAEKKWK